jgi:hypothetical protein
VNQWWAKNFDKVLTAVISIVISGVVGFFSAIFSIKSDMSNLKDRVVTIETELGTIVLPKQKLIDENVTNIARIQQDVATFKTQTDISISTNKLLDLRMEQVRAETVKDLKALLEDARKPAASK